ncbi:mitochondrial RNA binding protein [Trypanosoma equiperdum]|uniref:RNA-editing substrate-binding complex 5 protein domain-containing protein n=2 Tax=Trypanozoon TaxID=39700 RepID=Q389F5_TRYB2|nr:hypothetical protein, conserved [Trypanosoma brucei brucei TREU927]EAN78565.1 hypothetical protein, conserved [Trypanosoma brucei brucei TREU927]8FNC_5 Chain 5, Mitochondrial RNA binding protein [Trypanosoma brucei]8FNF_5 Chain 5, Mitochondrial RNA binding protein [Trypanosoma brucei]SCU69827.1 mitochondrial RNA binding protein [Trypanosoma equiperdum]
MLRHTSRNNALHAFVRSPHYRTIPSAGPNGIVVNRDMLVHQFRDFYKTLQHCSLVDKVHLMSERPSVEALRVADQMVSIGATFLEMPLTGMEHRATEFMESMRYVRGAGGPSTLASYLQDTENCRCNSGDVVCLPNGIAVGHGPRTNAVAHTTLKQLFEVKDDQFSFDVFTLEQEGDAPPLGDYFGFAGSNVLLTWKDEHGLLAVDQYQQKQPHTEMNVVYLEPGCHFLSFYGVDHTIDVLVQKGYERSMDSIAAAGLNPIPVQWSEMDKLGISMRAAVLPLKFFKANVGGMLSRNKSRGARWQTHQLQK